MNVSVNTHKPFEKVTAGITAPPSPFEKVTAGITAPPSVSTSSKPSGVESRQSASQQLQQLTSPEVPQAVGKLASELPSAQISENASSHQSVLAEIQATVPQASSSGQATQAVSKPVVQTDNLPPPTTKYTEKKWADPLTTQSSSTSEPVQHSFTMKQRQIITANAGKEVSVVIAELRKNDKFTSEINKTSIQQLKEQLAMLKDDNASKETIAAKEDEIKKQEVGTDKNTPASLKNTSDETLTKMITEARKTPVAKTPNSTRLMDLGGNVMFKLMRDAAPELNTEKALKPTIDKLNKERTELTGKLTEEQTSLQQFATENPAVAKIFELNTEIKAMKATHPLNEAMTTKLANKENEVASYRAALPSDVREGLLGKQTVINDLQSRIKEVDARLADAKTVPEKLENLKTEQTQLKNDLATDKQIKASDPKKGLSPTMLNLKEARLKEVERQVSKLEHAPNDHGHMAYESIKKSLLTDKLALGGAAQRQFGMEAVIDFRREFVMETYNQVKTERKAKALNLLQEELVKLNADNASAETIAAKKKEIEDTGKAWDAVGNSAVGSTDLTSDFDMTVLSVDKAGINTEILTEVNKRLGDKFGLEAGSVFDTNLYVNPYVETFPKEVKNGPKVWANQEALASHDEGQDIASLVKQRKYSSPEDWTAFVTDMGTALGAKLKEMNPNLSDDNIKQKVASQTARYTAADKLFTDSENAIKTKMAELRELPEHQGKSHFDLELTANNRLLEERMELADTIKSEWAKMPESTPKEKGLKDLKYAEYTRADTHANMFANEPYFSEGPMRHVVGNEQTNKNLQLTSIGGGKKQYKMVVQSDTNAFEGKKTLKITPTMALESLTENLGDFRKENIHLKGQPPGEIAIKGSKYMGRLARAIEYAIPPNKMSPQMRETLNNLQDAETELLPVRKGGSLPSPFTDKNAFAMDVLTRCRLFDPNKPNEFNLEKTFKDLKLAAEVEIRASLLSA